MLEALRLDGPASVGQLAQRLGVAVGSISHHMKSLHANGFVTPAPELARDTRESWWRPVSVRLSWSRYDFAEGTTAREVAELAARSIVERQMELIRSSLDHRVGFGSKWDRAGMISDTMAKATHEQVVALSTQLSSVVDAWRRDCTADAAEHPDADRAAIFVATDALPVRL
jgi:DNA-binding transcriptional ArsR family regulator